MAILVVESDLGTDSRVESDNVMSTAPDQTLERGIASRCNVTLLLIVLLLFPFVLRWSGALAVGAIPAESPQHTPALLRFSFTVTGFLWLCFAIALAGINSRGSVSWRRIVRLREASWSGILGDVGTAFATLLVLAVIGNLSNVLLGRYQQDSAMFRSMVARNSPEALAFLLAALTAGFVEEFVFRGYLQRQFTALFGSVTVASMLQMAVFTAGHFYQGWIRLVPVMLIGSVLTAVALTRKSLIPGMIAHGLGDGLVAFLYLAQRL